MEAEQTRALVDIVRRAGDAILEIYRTDFDVDTKDDDSPLTQADLAAHRIIAAGLEALTPDIPMISEESSPPDFEVRSGWPRYWLVDPLDGTKEFVKRRGDFTVNIAYVEDGEPIRGVVYAPARERLFYTRPDGKAVEEKGPFDPETPGETTPIGVRMPDNDALLVVASQSHRDQATDDYISHYSVEDLRSAGSSLKFCLVATGEADLYPRLGRTMEWDTAAGHAVLSGAGGTVVRFDDKTPLRYGKADFANPHFIAYAPGVTLKG